MLLNMCKDIVIRNVKAVANIITIKVDLINDIDPPFLTTCTMTNIAFTAIHIDYISV